MRPAALAARLAMAGVMAPELARPRIPSVPKYFRLMVMIPLCCALVAGFWQEQAPQILKHATRFKTAVRALFPANARLSGGRARGCGYSPPPDERHKARPPGWPGRRRRRCAPSPPAG